MYAYTYAYAYSEFGKATPTGSGVPTPQVRAAMGARWRDTTIRILSICRYGSTITFSMF
jgi:hypothetical protein